MLPKFYGRLAYEAQELARRATAIKIPRNSSRRLLVEYEFDDGFPAQFVSFRFVEPDSYMDRRCVSFPYLDFSRIRRGRSYDKRSGRRFVRDFRHNYFGPRKRLTKRRCERFFGNEKNFVRRGEVGTRRG
jgi:hypothetical protein